MMRFHLKSTAALPVAFFIFIFAIVGCNLSERLKNSRKPAEQGDKTINFFEGTAIVDAASRLKEKIGRNFKASQIIIYGVKVGNGFLVVQAQDPKNLENIDRYEYRSDGKVYGPSPVKVSGGGKLENILFDFDEINLAATPALAKEALARLNIDGGEVTLMTISRNTVRDNDIYWHVAVEGVRKKGFARADAKGNIVVAELY